MATGIHVGSATFDYQLTTELDGWGVYGTTNSNTQTGFFIHSQDPTGINASAGIQAENSSHDYFNLRVGGPSFTVNGVLAPGVGWLLVNANLALVSLNGEIVLSAGQGSTPAKTAKIKGGVFYSYKDGGNAVGGNGECSFGGNASNGATIIGQGSVSDFTVVNRNGAPAIQVPAASNVVKQAVNTVAGLPAASVGAGTRSFVSDSNTTTFNAVVAGGGGNLVPVFSDGTNWRVG